MPVKHINSYNELMTLIKSEQKAIIVKFSASWCGPCKMITPIFKKYADSEYGNKIVFVEVDVDEAPKIAEEFKVTSMPTFKAIRVRKIINEFKGASKEDLQRMVSMCC